MLQLLADNPADVLLARRLHERVLVFVEHLDDCHRSRLDPCYIGEVIEFLAGSYHSQRQLEIMNAVQKQFEAPYYYVAALVTDKRRFLSVKATGMRYFKSQPKFSLVKGRIDDADIIQAKKPKDKINRDS